MDMLLVRRRLPQAPFKCACGSVVMLSRVGPVVSCLKCERPTYHLLKGGQVTESGAAYEVVIAAHGVVITDAEEFAKQEFHVVITATGVHFFPDVPTIVGDQGGPLSRGRGGRSREHQASGISFREPSARVNSPYSAVTYSPPTSPSDSDKSGTPAAPPISPLSKPAWSSHMGATAAGPYVKNLDRALRSLDR